MALVKVAETVATTLQFRIEDVAVFVGAPLSYSKELSNGKVQVYVINTGGISSQLVGAGRESDLYETTNLSIQIVGEKGLSPKLVGDVADNIADYLAVGDFIEATEVCHITVAGRPSYVGLTQEGGSIMYVLDVEVQRFLSMQDTLVSIGFLDNHIINEKFYMNNTVNYAGYNITFPTGYTLSGEGTAATFVDSSLGRETYLLNGQTTIKLTKDV